jgi:hypothetical protein
MLPPTTDTRETKPSTHLLDGGGGQLQRGGGRCQLLLHGWVAVLRCVPVGPAGGRPPVVPLHLAPQLPSAPKSTRTPSSDPARCATARAAYCSCETAHAAAAWGRQEVETLSGTTARTSALSSSTRPQAVQTSMLMMPSYSRCTCTLAGQRGASPGLHPSCCVQRAALTQTGGLLRRVHREGVECRTIVATGSSQRRQGGGGWGLLGCFWHARAPGRGTAGEAVSCCYPRARNGFDRARTASAPQWHAIHYQVWQWKLRRRMADTRDQAAQNQPTPTFPWDALPSTLQRMVLSRLLDVWTGSRATLRVVSRRFEAQVDDVLTSTSSSSRWTDRWTFVSSVNHNNRQPRPSTGDENGLRGLGRLHALLGPDREKQCK